MTDQEIITKIIEILKGKTIKEAQDILNDTALEIRNKSVV